MKLSTLISSFAVLGCVGAVAAASMASQGCTATVTSSNNPGDDDSNPPQGDDAGSEDAGTTVVQQDAGSTPPNACNECLYETCSGLYAICVNDAACLGIFQCTTACAAGDDQCVEACFTSQPTNSIALYDNLGICDYNGECNGGACATACAPPASYCSPTGDDDGGTDAGGGTTDAGQTSDDAGTGVDSAAPQTCQQCQASACSSDVANTAQGTAGFAYTQCVLGCATAQCVSVCGTNNPAGVAASQALGTCTSQSCPVCTQTQQ